MPIRITFNLILASCFGLSWLGSTLYFEHQIQLLGSDAVSAEARLHMQASLAIREYTQDHVKPYFDAHPQLGFEAISVPAFSSKKTMDVIYRHYPGYSYREAALNPLNPIDLATSWERAVIERYRAPSMTDEQLARIDVMDSEDGLSLQAVKPILIANVKCLKCHGKPEDAPPALLSKYPGPGGFGWQLGEVVGAQFVTIPKLDHVSRFQKIRKSFELAFLAIFGSLFIILNTLLNRLVLQPLQSSNRVLSSMADTDALTSLPNRRAFDHGLAREIARTKAQGRALSVIMMDLDFFKSINDQFGHGKGDDVLQQFSRELSRKFRADDLFARLGGEEFIAMLPALKITEAAVRANALRQLCAELDFGLGRCVTVSMGVAQWDGTESPNSLIKRCDDALYRAKHQGRNRVELAP